MYHVSRTIEDACPYGFDQDMTLCANGGYGIAKEQRLMYNCITVKIGDRNGRFKKEKNAEVAKIRL